MKVKVTIQSPNGRCVEHIAKVTRDGDLLKAFGLAMEAYRNAHHDVPIFDHSTIKIERAGVLRRKTIKVPEE